ncbi:hypothetical protein RIF29_09065 [Crotalaria pallida]|uniref:Uncharacterized protein n=1 Tax=Crotalaria pallida TaxID=3830 RepID=A0AAN9FUI6_CROPI
MSGWWIEDLDVSYTLGVCDSPTLLRKWHTSLHEPHEGMASENASTNDWEQQNKTKLVKLGGHVEDPPWIMHPRRSGRARQENILLRDYVQGKKEH